MTRHRFGRQPCQQESSGNKNDIVQRCFVPRLHGCLTTMHKQHQISTTRFFVTNGRVWKRNAVFQKQSTCSGLEDYNRFSNLRVLGVVPIWPPCAWGIHNPSSYPNWQKSCIDMVKACYYISLPQLREINIVFVLESTGTPSVSAWIHSSSSKNVWWSVHISPWVFQNAANNLRRLSDTGQVESTWRAIKHIVAGMNAGTS